MVMISFVTELHFFVDELLYQGIVFIPGLDLYPFFVDLHFKVFTVFVIDVDIDTIGIYFYFFVVFIQNGFVLAVQADKLVLSGCPVMSEHIIAGILHIVAKPVPEVPPK